MLKYIIGLVMFIVVSLLGIILYFYSQIRFDIEKIVDYKPNLTTQFFDRNGDLVANIFKDEHRLYVEYEDIPPKIIEALVAIEDTQFFEHNGINTDAILRAIIKDIKEMSLVEGASTLTQQLVKNVVLTREKKFNRKAKEILLALRLETLLSKEEILERYLNQVYFGGGYYGIKTASLGYFKKELRELTTKEIAMLVGLPRAPSFYSPTRNLNFSLVRANQVVNRLYTLGWINELEYKNALSETPLVYKQTLTSNQAPYVIDYALAQIQKDIPDIKQGGYKVNLTIELQTQQIARDALKFGFDKIKERDEYFIKKENDAPSRTQTLNGALITIENHTGEILSLVGGIDYNESKFNRVIQSQRQAGSAIKPFLYQIALNLGYSPLSNLIDISRTYNYTSGDKEKKWQPKNFGENYKGIITFKDSLVYSRNLATINLVDDIGVDVVYNALKEFDIKDVQQDLTLTLGSFSISPFDMAKAFTIFSNNGVELTPFIIKSVEKFNGEKIVFEADERYVQPPKQAFLTTSILHEATQRGTGRLSRVKGLQIAGKTGTTNDNIDTWFAGYTPTLQTVIWYGNDNNTPMWKSETGGRSAGSAFAYFYKNYLALHPEMKRDFEPVEGVQKAYVNGKEEYFTDISKLPNTKNVKEVQTNIEF